MKIPLSWVREFAELPAKISNSDLEDAFVRVGFEVEEIIEAGSDLTGPLVVAKVESIEELSGNKKPILMSKCSKKHKLKPSKWAVCWRSTKAP